MIGNSVKILFTRSIIFKHVLLAALLLSTFLLHSQPMPVELMAGNRFVTIDFNASRKFSQASKFGFFHMNTIQTEYVDKSRDNFTIQDYLFYEVVKNVRITGGAYYGKGGFNTTAGFQLNYSNDNAYFLFAPRINITHVPSYDFMTILQYKILFNDNLKLYTRIKLLNLFDANHHIKSYQWFRLGLDRKGTQFGLAADINEYGPIPQVEYNLGLFVRKELF